jgi:hypothetical protein
MSADQQANGGEPVRGRRRLGRRRTDPLEPLPGAESAIDLQAELVLLREENARLKAAQHRGPDIAGLLARARALPAAEADPSSAADESTRLLVEGLVMRESMLEICREIERAMVTFEARLTALQTATPPAGTQSANGHAPPDA